MVNPIKVEMEIQDVLQMDVDQKLSALVKIAFSNHAQLTEQGKILFGNGEPKKGLCHKVAFQGALLQWMIGIGSFISITLVGLIIKVILR